MENSVYPIGLRSSPYLNINNLADTVTEDNKSVMTMILKHADIINIEAVV